jgi:hypothetical protein
MLIFAVVLFDMELHQLQPIIKDQAHPRTVAFYAFRARLQRSGLENLYYALRKGLLEERWEPLLISTVARSSATSGAISWK